MPQIYRISIYRNISSKVEVRAKWSLCGLPTGVTLWNVTNRQSWCRLAVSSLPSTIDCVLYNLHLLHLSQIVHQCYHNMAGPFFHFLFFYFPDNFFGKIIRSLDRCGLKLNILVIHTFGYYLQDKRLASI